MCTPRRDDKLALWPVFAVVRAFATAVCCALPCAISRARIRVALRGALCVALRGALCAADWRTLDGDAQCSTHSTNRCPYRRPHRRPQLRSHTWLP